MIYAPILNNTQAAFLANTESYSISFTLPKYVSLGDIKHIQVYIVKQSNNSSIADLTQYPDGIIYKSIEQNMTLPYSVTILRSDLIQSWEPGAIYKIQLRFGQNELFSSLSDFADWKSNQTKNEAFSEWSNVMVVKAITKPTVIINNTNELSGDNWILNTPNPLFTGTYQSDPINHETMNQFRFELYNNQNELIETSDWLTDNIQHRFKTILVDHESYIVKLQVETINGYICNSEDFAFTVILDEGATLKNTDLYGLLSDQRFGQDNAAVKLYLKTDQLGVFTISRSDESSNYTIWEDLGYVETTTGLPKGPIYIDYTIESGISYKYAISKEYANGVRSAPLINNIYDDSNIVVANDPYSYFIPLVNNAFCYFFEYNYLYRDNMQLRLQYDSKINSFKHTVLRSKQDTLGDKYPHLVSNGYAYYAEFPLTGLITLHMDSDSTFFKWDESKGLMCGEELIAPLRMFTYNTKGSLPREETRSNQPNISNNNDIELYNISTDLIHENVFIERKVREKIEAWLNDFTYKLYKSPTEGNIIIGLTNVSLTPKQELGRMIYEFSATAYELADNTINNLKSLNILSDYKEQTIEKQKFDDKIFGQIIVPNSNGIDILSQIQQQQQTVSTKLYNTSLKEINDIWIDRYDSNTQTQQETEDTVLKNAIANAVHPNAASLQLTVNGNNVVILPEKTYAYHGLIEDLTVPNNIAYPFIINYAGIVTKTYNSDIETEMGLAAPAFLEQWGQLSGIFSTDPETLSQYDANYLASETERIFNPLNNQTVNAWEKSSTNDTNYNVYRQTDILAVIKDEAVNYTLRQEGATSQEGDIYNTPHGQIRVTFEGLDDFKIEGDPGSELIINGDTIKIGYFEGNTPLPMKYLNAVLAADDQGRQLDISIYTLTDYKQYKTKQHDVANLDIKISELQSARPQFLIVDYKCRIRIESLNPNGG